AVDVELDVAVRVVGVEVQELRDDRVGDARVDARPEVDDTLREQVRVDIHDPVAAGVRRDDGRYRVRAHASTPRPAGRRRRGAMSAKSSTIASMNPYSSASCAVYQRSCSESSKMRSVDWPVSAATMPSTMSRM